MTDTDTDLGTPYTLSDLHEAPWSRIEGAYARVRQEADQRDPHPPHDDGQDRVTTEEREGELVGRAEGTGLYYDSERGRNIPDSIGPAIYLDTPEDTILKVRTDKCENELLAFNREGGDA